LTRKQREWIVVAATKRHRTGIWSGIGHDLRTAARRLAGQPASTAFTIITLALAIGVAAAVFSVVDQMILRPPPFLHGDRLVNVLSQTGPGRSGGSGLTAEKILGWQEQPAVFERLEGYIGATFDLTESAEPKQVVARVVSLGLFDMLGIRMHIGRPFAEGDGAPGSAKVAILSHQFWTTQFGGSPGALGSQIVLNDERYTIVGVLRPRVTLFTGDEPVWLPFDLHAWGTRAPYRFIGIGRLNVALDVGRARPAAGAIAAKLDESTPLRATWHLGIEEKRSAQLAASARQTLFVLLGAVALLLLLACVNVTSFALGQALRRERELRLRAAIGAGRWRLLRESLVETVLVAAGAGTVAMGIANVALAVLLAAAPHGMANMQTRAVEIDPRVLAVMTLVTLTAGLLTGLVPGLRSSRIELSSAFGDGARGSSRGLSFGAGIGGLVVIEVALAMVLLVGSTLMSRTLSAYYAIEPGFDVDGLMTAELALPSNRYPDEQARRDFFAALDAALKRQGGIAASAYAWGIPPAAGSLSGQLQAEGRQPTSGEIEYFANAVSPTYFETTGTPLLAGRPFTPADTDDQVILSQALARLLWGDEPALGKRMKDSVDGKWLTVVGVAGTVESRWDRSQRSDLQFYIPLALPRAAAAPPSSGPVRRTYIRQLLIVRAANPALVPATVRAQIRGLDPNLPVGTFASGTDLYARPFAEQQFVLTVMGAFAGTALLLAAMGIFGVLSQAVTRRRREIGIRRALGAGSPRLIRMLVGRGVALAAAGAAIGAAASLAGVSTLEGLLFGVSPFDAASFALVAAVILVVALLACWWPTIRALRVEPAEVLRSE
jgi:predicted permease